MFTLSPLNCTLPNLSDTLPDFADQNKKDIIKKLLKCPIPENIDQALNLAKEIKSKTGLEDVFEKISHAYLSRNTEECMEKALTAILYVEELKFDTDKLFDSFIKHCRIVGTSRTRYLIQEVLTNRPEYRSSSQYGALYDPQFKDYKLARIVNWHAQLFKDGDFLSKAFPTLQEKKWQQVPCGLPSDKSSMIYRSKIAHIRLSVYISSYDRVAVTDQWICVINWDGNKYKALLFNVLNGELSKEIEVPFSCYKVKGQGDIFCFTSYNNEIYTLNAENDELKYFKVKNQVRRVAFVDDRLLITTTKNDEYFVLFHKTGEIESSNIPHPNPDYPSDIRSGRTYKFIDLKSVSKTGVHYIGSVDDGIVVRKENIPNWIKIPCGKVSCCCIDENLFVTAKKNKFQFWHAETGELLGELETRLGQIYEFFLTHKKIIAVMGLRERSMVQILDVIQPEWQSLMSGAASQGIYYTPSV